MKLPLRDFPTLVQSMAAGVQGASRALVDLAVGSVLRAVLEANASLALWLQWLIVQVLAMTRAATSGGADLDSWMADFAVARLPAVAASGQVVLSRFTTGLAALVPVGTELRSGDGALSFLVVADSGAASFDAGQGGYVLAADAASVTVPVQAAVPGAAGNVQAGGISQIAQAIPGVDTVTNPLPLTGGLDGESDAALRQRFHDWTISLARATPRAVMAAVASVQQGLSCVVAEGVDTSGAPRAGFFVVTVDDGSGNPPDSLLATVSEAVEAVRPVGTGFAVQRPVLVQVDVSLTVTVSAGTAKGAVAQAVAAAVTAWIDALPVGAALPLTRIAMLAYGASPAVVNVSQVTLNGAGADLVPPANGVVRAAQVVVNQA